MKLSEFIKQLKEIQDEIGDGEVVVDTEARTFDCHIVDVRAVSNMGNEVCELLNEKDMCIISL